MVTKDEPPNPAKTTIRYQFERWWKRTKEGKRLLGTETKLSCYSLMLTRTSPNLFIVNNKHSGTSRSCFRQSEKTRETESFPPPTHLSSTGLNTTTPPAVKDEHVVPPSPACGAQ